jgi:hypothetical protein
MHRFFSGHEPVLWTSGVFAAMALMGCNNVPTFPQYGPDAAIECGEEGLTCPSSEVCLQGHCYAMCTATSCGPLENCVGGICIPFTGDAGFDVGMDTPPDPCTGVTCVAPTPVCVRGGCVACTIDDSGCGGGTPICRVSRNDCVSFASGAVCEPCNTTADCTGGATCQVIGTIAPERVCLLPCGAGCANGTTCDTALDACRPASAASCFQYLASIAAAPCTADTECAPNGASFEEGLFAGSCNPGTGTCRFPCGVPGDCVSGVCDTASGFCM